MGTRNQALQVLLLLSRFSCVRLCATPRRQPTRLRRPWDSPGKNTGVGCHFLRQCMKMKSESEVAQSCPTLCNPTDCSLPGSSIHSFSSHMVVLLSSLCIHVSLCLSISWLPSFCICEQREREKLGRGEEREGKNRTEKKETTSIPLLFITSWLLFGFSPLSVTLMGPQNTILSVPQGKPFITPIIKKSTTIKKRVKVYVLYPAYIQSQ